MSKRSDVLIVGASFVGLWASIVLSQQGLSVVLVDKRSWNDIALNVSSNVFAITDNVYRSLLKHGVSVSGAYPVMNMQVGTVSHFPALSWGEPCQSSPLAWTIPAVVLWDALMEKVKMGDISCRDDFSPSSCMLSHESVQLLDKHGSSIDADVILAADGTNSWLRRYWNVCCSRKNQVFPSKTAVFSVKWAKQDLSTASQWFGENFGVIAFLPGGIEGSATCVWSLPANHFLWREDDIDWCAYLCRFLDIDESSLSISGEVNCFDIEEYVVSAVRPRCVFLGNASCAVHPLAGQGLNIGFRGVLSLAKLWENRSPFRPLSDPTILRAYGRKAEMEAKKWLFITRSLWYASANPVSLELLARGLLLADRLVFAKNWLARCAQ